MPKGRAKRDSEASQEVHLRGILDLLRRSSTDESNEILDKMRLAPSIEDFVESFVVSGVSLPRMPLRRGQKIATMLNCTDLQVLHRRVLQSFRESSLQEPLAKVCFHAKQVFLLTRQSGTADHPGFRGCQVSGWCVARGRLDRSVGGQSLLDSPVEPLLCLGQLTEPCYSPDHVSEGTQLGEVGSVLL